MNLTLLVLMALAAYRLWRLIGKDSWPPSEAFRNTLEADAAASFAMAYRHDGGPEAENLNTFRVRKYTRRGRRLATEHELITCPWCLGAWISFAVVAWVDFCVGLELPVLQAFAVAGAVGLLGGLDD